ncbi:MAG: hypothetical protein AAFQ04_12930, partial [Pseudomonadota bacterium]
MKRTRTLTLAATTVLAGISLSPNTALAQVVGNDVIAALNTQLSYQGGSLSGGSVSTNGDTVVVTGATLSLADEEDGFAISELTFSGVEADGSG